VTADALLPPVAAIPAAATIRDGLTREADRCWMILNPDGTPNTELFFEDQTPHFGTLKDAVAAAFPNTYDETDDERPPMPDVRPTELPEPCWTATAACGYRYDEEGDEGVVHFANRDEAATAVLGNDWRVRDGVLLCSDKHCEECR
jgi:hypothetical protein